MINYISRVVTLDTQVKKSSGSETDGWWYALQEHLVQKYTAACVFPSDCDCDGLRRRPCQCIGSTIQLFFATIKHLRFGDQNHQLCTPCGSREGPLRVSVDVFGRSRSKKVRATPEPTVPDHRPQDCLTANTTNWRGHWGGD